MTRFQRAQLGILAAMAGAYCWWLWRADARARADHARHEVLWDRYERAYNEAVAADLLRRAEEP